MSAGKSKKRKIKKSELIFILSAVILPCIHWLVFYVYPNIASIGMAFINSDGLWSLDNFKRFFTEFSMSTSALRIGLRNTLLTFGINLVMFIPQVLVSYFIYKKIPGAGIYRVLFFLPSIIFSVCTAMMFTRVMGTTGFIAQGIGKMLELDYTPELLADSRFANYVVLGHMVWLGFPGNLIIWGGTFARIPEDVLESARIDGVTWWQEFTKNIVPLVWPTVALQMVLTFCGILGSSGAVFLLTGGEYGTMTLSAWLYITLMKGSGNAYTSTVYNYLSAVGLMMTIVAVAISLFVRKITDKAFNEVEF